MAGPKAAGVAGGSPQHTPKQDETAEAATPAPLDDITPAQFEQLLDRWKAQEDEYQRGAQALGRVRAFAEGHTTPLTTAQLTALEKLREPFEKDQIEKRPQPWCKACNASPDRVCGKPHKKIECKVCGTWITEAHNDLDYVGHAGATARLLSVDPTWDWEPLAVDDKGLPYIDERGGMWIKLTVCGMTRKGYGDAVGKKANTTAVKEIIGDAIRNAGMRFGMALDLWSKADLHKESEPEPHPAEPFLESINRKAVWESAKWLEGVRASAEEAGQLDYSPPNSGGATLADIIDGRLAHLTESARIEAELRIEREEQRKAATAAVAAEYNIGPNAGGQQAPPGGGRPPQSAPPAGPPPNEEPLTAQSVRDQAQNLWLDADGLTDLLNKALAARLGNELVNPGEPRAGTLRQALSHQVKALREAANSPRTGTSRASNAAHQYADQPDDSDWGNRSDAVG